MKYKGLQQFSHQQPDRTGVLLVNLGTPDAPTPAALRKYLAEFLWDPRVVEIPRPLWWLILHGIILRVRPARSAHAYQSVWTDEGSPLLSHSIAIRNKLADALAGRCLVELAMRYGNPSLSAGVDRLLEQGARQILVVPLYPQYSATTTGSVFDAVASALGDRRWIPDLQFVTSYHDEPAYIESCREAIASHWQHQGKPDKLILSFHGIPRRNLDLGDPYYCHSQKTARLIAAALELGPDEYLTTFQSRFGKAEWLQPYTDKTLQKLGADGVGHVQVFCPGFAADCLETLEEIAVENRDYFLSAGGHTFSYIPALNARDSHVTALREVIERRLRAWRDAADGAPDLQERSALAADRGATV